MALLYEKFVNVYPENDGPKSSQPMFLELFTLAQALPGPGSTQPLASLGANLGGLGASVVTFFMWILSGFIVMRNVGRWYDDHVNEAAGSITSLTDHSVGMIAAPFSGVLLAAFKIALNTCGFDRINANITRAEQGNESVYFLRVYIYYGIPMKDIKKYRNKISKNRRFPDWAG